MAVVSLEINIVVLSFVAITFKSSQLLAENIPDLFGKSENNFCLLFSLAVLIACEKQQIQISVNRS